MPESKIEPLKPEKAPDNELINDDVGKGVLVDSLGLFMADDFAFFDGIVGSPRFKKDTVVARLIFSIAGLRELQGLIGSALKDYDEKCKKTHEDKK